MFDREKQDSDLKNFDIEADLQSQNDNFQSNFIKKNRSYVLLTVILCVFIAAGVIYNYFILSDKAKTTEQDSVVMFVPLEEITINLKNSVESKSSWLRMKVVLEVQGKNNYDFVSKMTPRIIDIFHTYLKELRKTDLDGSFGIYKIKDEMTLRINTILNPAKIDSILFQELVIQTF